MLFFMLFEQPWTVPSGLWKQQHCVVWNVSGLGVVECVRTVLCGVCQRVCTRHGVEGVLGM
jgi:hypothetical protein